MSDEKLDLLVAEIRATSAKLEVLETNLKSRPATSDPPAERLTVLLGIPALLIVILMNWGQAGLNFHSQEKTIAETEKLRTEELKERAELQQLLSKVESKDPHNAVDAQEVVNELVPQIRRAFDSIIWNSAVVSSSDAARLLGRYLLIWGLIFLVGLFFGILNQIWSAFLGLLIQNAHREANYEKQGVWKWIRTIGSSLYPIPSIGHWIVEVIIFLGVVVPFLAEVAYVAGAPTEYFRALQKLQSGELGEAFEAFKSIFSAQIGTRSW